MNARILTSLSVMLLQGALAGCASERGPDPATPTAAESDNDAQQLVQKGYAAFEQGDGVRAEQYLTLAMERGYDRGKLLPVLLQICLSSSRLRAALNHAEPYLSQHPEDHALSYLVANIHLSLGQPDEARHELQALLKSDAKHVDAHYLMGVLESEVDSSKAREHFAAYLTLAPRGERAAEVRRRLSELEIQEAESSASASSDPIAVHQEVRR